MRIKAVIAGVIIMIVSLQPSLWAAEKKPGIIAVVNGKEIALDDFSRELYRLERMILNAGKPLTCPQITRLRTEVAEGLVRRELLFQEGKNKVHVTDAEINGELDKLRGEFQSGADFAKASAALRVQVEQALVIRKIIDDQFASKAVVTDKEIRSYYDENRDSFRQPEQVKASHILIKTDAGNEAGKAAARKKMEDIRKKALEGQDFASLARTYSEDVTGPKGGDLGYIRQGQILKPVEDALFALKPGEVSEVVETGIGYHLVKAYDRKPETTIPFETVKDRLRTLLKQGKGQQEANAYIGKVREKARVEIFLPTEQ